MGLSGPALASLGVASLAFVVLLLAQTAAPHLAIYWLLGLGLGAVLQRGRFCFAGAFRDLYLTRNGTMMRAILVAMALTTPIFALIEAKAVPNPSFGALPSGAHVLPFGLNLLVGGVLFGVGMVVAGGCVSGSLYRIGEGYLASWASLAGILIGLSAAAHTWNAWWTWHLQYAPRLWLPALLGYDGAVALSLGLLAIGYLGVLKWESAGGLPAFYPSTDNRPVFEASFRGRLQAIRASVFGPGWPPLVAATALAGLSGAAYLVDHPIGVTGELAAWADRASGLVGLAAPPLLGAEFLAGCNLVLEKLGLVSDYTLLDGGLIVGSLFAALLAGEFKLRVPRQPRRYVQSLGGGTLMGYGAGIAVGCTLGAFFSAIPSLGLNGWLFGLALLAGAGLGTQIIRRLA